MAGGRLLNQQVNKLLNMFVLTLSIAILFLGTTVSAQRQNQVLKIRDFRGLNTIDGIFAIQPNEARFCHNIDLSINSKSLTKRWGYDSVSVMDSISLNSHFDSILAIYGAYYSDGTQQLFAVGALADSGYGVIFTSALGSSNLSAGARTRIWDKWSTQNIPKFATFNDNVYVVNGTHRGIVYNGDIARSMPINAPGEPTIIPLSLSGNLNGEYYYLFKLRVKGTIDGSVNQVATYNSSPLSLPVNIKSGKMFISDFQFIPSDTFFSTADIDSAEIFIYRTKANPKQLTEEDSVWAVDSISVADSSAMVAATYTDNVADGSLGSPVPIIDFTLYGMDSTKQGDGVSAYTRRYGSVTYLATGTGGDTGSTIFKGWLPNVTDTLGFSYKVTFVDTITGIESKASQPIVILNDSSYAPITITSIRLGLPPVTDTGVAYKLYRSPVYRIIEDSAFQEDYANIITDHTKCWWSEENCASSDWEKTYTKSGVQYCYRCIEQDLPPDTVITQHWTSVITLDSISTPNYRFVAQIPSDSSAFTDNLNQDNIERNVLMHPSYSPSAPPAAMTNIFAFQGRMYGTYKSYLAWGNIRDPLDWGAFDKTPIGKNDGDVITLAYPTRTAIVVKKNKSSFNVYPGIDAENYTDWSAVEVSSQYGCIAPNSYAVGLGGHYYLSENGVIRENEGQYLERTYQKELVSRKLDNFDKLSLSVKSKAYGFYFDQKYMLKIGDTLYVYDEKVDGWSTWDIPIQSATTYGVETNLNFIPGDTMYFVATGDTTLYRYKTVEWDNGSPIDFNWKSAPLLIDELNKQINYIALWLVSDSLSADMTLTLTDQEDTSGFVGDLTYGPEKYQKKAVGTNIGKYFYIKLSTGFIPYIIDGIDVHYVNQGKSDIE